MPLRRILVVLCAVLILAAAGGTAALAAGSAQAGPSDQSGSSGGTHATAAADRAYLGVIIVVINPGIRQVFTLPEDVKGVAVLGTLPRSPAETAGITRGDVIVSVAGNPTETPKGIEEIVRSASPGTSLVLQVWRAGSVRDVSVTLGERPAPQRPPRQPRPLPELQRPPDWLRHVYGFAKNPNAVDLTLRFASGDDTTPHILQLTLGTLATAPSDVQVVLQPKLGGPVVFTVTPDTAYYKGTRKVTSGDLDNGARVVTVVLDGALRAVVAGPFAAPKHRPHPGRPGHGALPPPRILSPDHDSQQHALREQRHADLKRLHEAEKGERDQIRQHVKEFQHRLKELRKTSPDPAPPAPAPTPTPVPSTTAAQA